MIFYRRYLYQSFSLGQILTASRLVVIHLLYNVEGKLEDLGSQTVVHDNLGGAWADMREREKFQNTDLNSTYSHKRIRTHGKVVSLHNHTKD